MSATLAHLATAELVRRLGARRVRWERLNELNESVGYGDVLVPLPRARRLDDLTSKAWDAFIEAEAETVARIPSWAKGYDPGHGLGPRVVVVDGTPITFAIDEYGPIEVGLPAPEPAVV